VENFWDKSRAKLGPHELHLPLSYSTSVTYDNNRRLPSPE
jgi:hypothetical protein